MHVYHADMSTMHVDSVALFPAAARYGRHAPTSVSAPTIHNACPWWCMRLHMQVLQAALDECGDDVPQAVRWYSQLRAKDAEALVEMSRSLDGGFLTFVLPLIVDSLLNRLLPQVRNTATTQ